MPLLYTQAAAKARFLQICRDVAATHENAFVKDKAGVRYMAITTVQPGGELRPVQVSPQRFKDNFARFSSLIRVGFVFSFAVKGAADLVYVRRYSRYSDPLEDIFAECLNMVRNLGPAATTAKSVDD